MSLENEDITDVFYFRGDKNKNYIGTLTKNRLIIKIKNTEESFPLNKITSIKINYSKRYYFIVSGIILVFGMIWLTVYKFNQTNIIVNLFFFIIGLISILFGYLGRTKIYIGQANGNRAYFVAGKNDKLFEFKDKVNNMINRMMIQGNVT